MALISAFIISRPELEISTMEKQTVRWTRVASEKHHMDCHTFPNIQNQHMMRWQEISSPAPYRHVWKLIFGNFHRNSLAGVEIKVIISCSLRALRIRLLAIGLSKIRGIQLKLHWSLDWIIFSWTIGSKNWKFVLCFCLKHLLLVKWVEFHFLK